VDGKGMFHRRSQASPIPLAVLAVGVALALGGCGSATTLSETTTTGGTIPKGRPQAIEPTAGAQAVQVTPEDPVGDPNAHATPLSVVKRELRQEHVAVSANNATYIDPL